MASLKSFSSFRFVLTACASLALVACGGGGSKDGDASAQSASAQSADGRVAYMWEFEDAAASTTQQYYPTKDGAASTKGVMTACRDISYLVKSCSVTQVAGRAGGRALHFDPKADDSFAWISGGHEASFCVGDIFQFNDPYGNSSDWRMTVAMWIKPDQIDQKQTYHLFGTGNPKDLAGYISASFHVRLVNGKVHLSLYRGTVYTGGPDLELDSKTTISVTPTGDNWHHVAVTYRDGIATIYLDGKAETTSTSVREDKSLCAGHRPYYLGGMSSTKDIDGGNAEESSFTFPGAIDQLVFSNKAFTSEQIQKLAAGLPVN